MEMKQISETTLKITVSLDDLELYGMELKDFLVPKEKTEEFFYTMLDEVDLPDNFKNSGMLSFRVTPRKDRIDVFVTKSELKEDLDFEDLANLDDISQMDPEEFFKSIEKNLMKKGDTKAHEMLKQVEDMVDGMLTKSDSQEDVASDHAIDKDVVEQYVHYVFRFDDVKEVVDFATAVTYDLEASELYKEDKTYYLTILLDLENKPSYYANLMYARMLEHAQVSLRTRAYLQEHATLLLSYHAVDELKQLGE
ncbi:adaptor protein MecA [Streptococcus sp. sy010]|uniref:adaptor protein MecA n=1 Tax=Streptococcus sp. sy010 TaxID=2600148 RepID=UPI0011B58BA4|nr:adaptor protein MecA [Streptococcus sp. sy010]TWT14468.1 adaptor protein MecA [Streptococcus sp. sy010]